MSNTKLRFPDEFYALVSDWRFRDNDGEPEVMLGKDLADVRCADELEALLTNFEPRGEPAEIMELHIKLAASQAECTKLEGACDDLSIARIATGRALTELINRYDVMAALGDSLTHKTLNTLARDLRSTLRRLGFDNA